MATQSEINAALGLPPGINPDGSWNAQDYMERRVAGQVDTQAQVNAALAANPYSAQNMAKVDITRPGQYVQDEGGNYVALSPNVAGYDATNPTALTYLGELRARGGNDSTSQAFNATATPAQKAEADRLWSVEKARLEEIDRKAALAAQSQPTGLLTGQVDQGANRGADAKAVANPAALPKGFLEGLAAIPNVTDQQIVTAMKTANVSPKNLADGLGISEGEIIARVAGTVPNGETIQLGDTIVQPKYRIIGDGQDQQIGPIENVFSYRASDNKVGGGYTQYAADGTVERVGTQMKVDATKDFLKFALGATALFGGAALAGLGPQVQAANLTAAELATTGLSTSEIAALTAQDLAIGGTTGAGLLGGGVGTVAGTVAGAASTLGGASTASSLLGGSALANSLLTSAGTGVVNRLLGGTSGSANISNLISGGLGTAGNLLQMQQSREAAQQAQARIDAETAAAKQSAAFRPVGMTTRFGTSQFTTDPVTGQLTSAGYTASPGVLEAQNRLVALGNQGLAQAEGAQAQFAPLQAGATSLFTLGNKYLAQTPQDVAQNYLAQQMALLNPGRELEFSNLQTKLRNQGRLGLSVAQGGDLGATTPELQALYNARARQDAELAANAQLAGQRDVMFGSSLLGQGAQAMGQYYGGQQASYAPYTTALGQFQNLETLAQQPLTMGAALGQQAATAGANIGRLGLTGAQLSTNLATSADATRNLGAQSLIAAGNPNAMFGQALGSAFGGLFNSNPSLTAGFTPSSIGASELGYPNFNLLYS
jgi:hypothetical protein